MKLLVGLGNPGKQYEQNRHNVGFTFADFLKNQIEGESFTYEKNLDSELSTLQINNNKIIVAKPQTFMNRSGQSVSRILNYYHVLIEDLYITHDDLDIPLGKFKIQKSTGPKLHNGLASIESSLGTADFWRIRIGVENRDSSQRLPGEAFVLQNFTIEEKNIVQEMFKEVIERLTSAWH